MILISPIPFADRIAEAVRLAEESQPAPKPVTAFGGIPVTFVVNASTGVVALMHCKLGPLNVETEHDGNEVRYTLTQEFEWAPVAIFNSEVKS